MRNILLNCISALIGIAMVILMCVTVLGSVFTDSMEKHEWAEAAHVVEAGETLWDMAQVYCPKDVDCRDWIGAVSKLNGVDGYIYPGEELVVLMVK